MRTLHWLPVFVGLVASVDLTSAADLASSCASIFPTYQYTGKAEGQTLLAVVDGKLIDAFDAVLPPRSAEHQFYYVYKSSCTQESPCVAQPIIAIKTMKGTNFPAPGSVYLSREGGGAEWNISRSAYDQFHNADETIPPEALSKFHVTYRDSNNKKLHTHYPTDRRRMYLFSSPTNGKSPWLKARNYVFEYNGLAQCIPFTMQIQRNTESALIEIIEIEDGKGGVPDKIQQWPLKLRLP
jgi:hypothetical protein